MRNLIAITMIVLGVLLGAAVVAYGGYAVGGHIAPQRVTSVVAVHAPPPPPRTVYVTVQAPLPAGTAHVLHWWHLRHLEHLAHLANLERMRSLRATMSTGPSQPGE